MSRSLPRLQHPCPSQDDLHGRNRDGSWTAAAHSALASRTSGAQAPALTNRRTAKAFGLLELLSFRQSQLAPPVLELLSFRQSQLAPPVLLLRSLRGVATHTSGARTPVVPTVVTRTSGAPAPALTNRRNSHHPVSTSGRFVRRPGPYMDKPCRAGDSPSAYPPSTINSTGREHYIEFPREEAAQSRRSGADSGFPARGEVAGRMERFVQ